MADRPLRETHLCRISCVKCGHPSPSDVGGYRVSKEAFGHLCHVGGFPDVYLHDVCGDHIAQVLQNQYGAPEWFTKKFRSWFKP